MGLTFLVLQARLDSSRLFQKSLLDLGGKPLVSRVMDALNQVPADMRILACPEDCRDAFEPLCVQADFRLFCGPKEDVLERYCLALECYSGKNEIADSRLVRATGDNPFVFIDAAAALLQEASLAEADYAGYRDLPYGAGGEVVKSAALLKARKEARSREEREHVCPYLYNHPEIFSVHRPLAPEPWRDGALRITVDTREDYGFAQKLYAELSKHNAEPEYRSLESGGNSLPAGRYRGENIIKAARSIR